MTRFVPFVHVSRYNHIRVTKMVVWKWPKVEKWGRKINKSCIAPTQRGLGRPNPRGCAQSVGHGYIEKRSHRHPFPPVLEVDRVLILSVWSRFPTKWDFYFFDLVWSRFPLQPEICVQIGRVQVSPQKKIFKSLITPTHRGVQSPNPRGPSVSPGYGYI